MSKVVVTGGSGFVGGHCIAQLIAAGHDVRTTVRDMSRAEEVRRAAGSNGEDSSRVDIVTADLLNDAGWAEAAEGADYILHVASPFPSDAPANADELIIPARDGALRVLRAARDAGVKRVVMTSSFAAVGYGIPQREQPFDERDWTDPSEPSVQAYMQSKFYAERAAWDFIDREGGELELSVINPTGIFGPVLGSDVSTSVGLIQGLLAGAMPKVPRISFGAVDVRDVADLHIRAMTAPAARGERFIAVAGKALWLIEAAHILREELGVSAAKVPLEEMPDAEVRRLAERAPALEAMVPQLGILREATAGKAERLLGWQPRPARDAIIATARSLMNMEPTPAA
ncbi:SDR family oxidoreductase [Sphingomonas crocodyli]|uniref:Aldehyde reductase n=1 Tax=Sphingomonas crocodyli TaxID=1979270 RepID=A0A437LZV9_9SPHN|nr:aldehyde reductase [Sphingomonas crocodyli]RVT90905.1 aldehyde reductase [Sphingomonas crocodyli]